MFEQQHKPVASRRKFVLRIVRNLVIGITLSAISLYLGMWGYHYFETLSWTDSYLNAAMILSGMGPVHTPLTQSGKLFAGTYALFSGIIFIVIIGVIFAPLFHRFLHKFLVQESDKSQDDSSNKTKKG